MRDSRSTSHPCFGESERLPSFKFIHSDIYNSAYWRSGHYDAQSWFKQFDETDFDSIKYAIAPEETFNLTNFHLLKTYQKLSVFEKNN